MLSLLCRMLESIYCFFNDSRIYIEVHTSPPPPPCNAWWNAYLLYPRFAFKHHRTRFLPGICLSTPSPILFPMAYPTSYTSLTCKQWEFLIEKWDKSCEESMIFRPTLVIPWIASDRVCGWKKKSWLQLTIHLSISAWGLIIGDHSVIKPRYIWYGCMKGG